MKTPKRRILSLIFACLCITKYLYPFRLYQLWQVVGVHQRYNVSPLAPNRAGRKINLNEYFNQGFIWCARL